MLLQRFERFSSIFIAQDMIKNLPSLNPATFKRNFVVYMETDEYFDFIGAIRDETYEFENKPRFVQHFLSTLFENECIFLNVFRGAYI